MNDTCKLDFSQMVENLLSGVIILDKRDIVYANSYVYQILQYEANEIKNIDQILHPEYYEVCKERLNRVYNKQETVELMEQRFIQKYGSIINVELFATPYIVDDRIFAQVHFRDISESKQYKKELEHSRYKYRMISENISDIISEVSLEGTILYISPSIKELIGYDAKNLINEPLLHFIHEDDHETVRQLKEQLLNGEKQVTIRYRARKIQGDYVWVESRGKLMHHENNTTVIIDTRNITQRLKTEKLLRQSEKLAVIGELSAGVVHEIKNPLTSIKGFLQLMEAGTIKTEDYISILNIEIERIEQIASDLLGFAKPSEELKPENLEEVLDEVIFLLNAQADKKNIMIEWNKPTKHVPVLGEKTQLKQVFINLIKNAIEASEFNTRIVVKMEEQDNNAIIRIVDQGHGIPEETLSKIGESFFTTKEKGTGLGLMVTHKIIENHKGTIEIESEVGKGSTFTVRLPIFLVNVSA
ncbi:PAS domain S-box protein [Radiobacillus deserti]|uniref:histidine kinase n=1 Tax=Radiobacillus deserti TaxID=2594883 RepID=A0A516KG38_9BACI|nr:PAS domain S-box protein [Radiobacillus deserti]QDP40319.1 PAS domain S-box protein [Radiobacillus deserti]